MPLSCAQRLTALSNSPSASDTLLGSVLVRIRSQRPRVDSRRLIVSEPSATNFRKSAIRLVRACQLAVSGDKTKLSATSRNKPAAAAKSKIFWRFLISIGFPSFPLKVEGELQRRLAAHLVGFQSGYFLGRAQLIEQLEIGLIVAGHSRTGHHGEIPDFQVLGGDIPIFGKC